VEALFGRPVDRDRVLAVAVEVAGNRDVARVAEIEGDVGHTLSVRVPQIHVPVALAIEPGCFDPVPIPVATECDVAGIAEVEGVDGGGPAQLPPEVEAAAHVLEGGDVAQLVLGARGVDVRHRIGSLQGEVRVDRLSAPAARLPELEVEMGRRALGISGVADEADHLTRLDADTVGYPFSDTPSLAVVGVRTVGALAVVVEMDVVRGPAVVVTDRQTAALGLCLADPEHLAVGNRDHGHTLLPVGHDVDARMFPSASIAAGPEVVAVVVIALHRKEHRVDAIDHFGEGRLRSKDHRRDGSGKQDGQAQESRSDSEVHWLTTTTPLVSSTNNCQSAAPEELERFR